MRSVAAHYQRHARRLARSYAEVAFEDVHGALLPYLPRRGARVVDVGAGAGRDAYALAARGYQVVAIEPSAAMRNVAQSPSDTSVDWKADRLPKLASILKADLRFDFVLCSAVLMHVAPADLGEALSSLSAIAKPGAIVAITLRDPRSDDPPGVFHLHRPADVIASAELSGLNLIEQGFNQDVFGRPTTAWNWFVFRAGQ